MSIDWEGLFGLAEKEGGFTPVPPGEYAAVVDESVFSLSKTTNKEMIRVRFKISAGPLTGRTLFRHLVLSPENGKAVAIFFRNLEALGVTKEFFANKPTMEQIAATLVGRGCIITTDLREYNGQQRDNVSGMKAGSGGVAVSRGPVMPAGPSVPQPGRSTTPAPINTPAPPVAPPVATPAPIPTPVATPPAPIPAPTEPESASPPAAPEFPW